MKVPVHKIQSCFSILEDRNFSKCTAEKHVMSHYDNNNNNKLQFGYHPVAVVILHVHKYGKKKVTREFKSGGLHERHVVATWKLGNHLSIRL